MFEEKMGNTRSIGHGIYDAFLKHFRLSYHTQEALPLSFSIIEPLL